MLRLSPVSCFAIAFALLPPTAAQAVDSMEFGFSKLDVTPTEPVRLSGYANRSKPFDGVVQKLWARTMVLRAADGKTFALVSVDSIGFPGVVTKNIASRLESSAQIKCV